MSSGSGGCLGNSKDGSSNSRHLHIRPILRINHLITTALYEVKLCHLGKTEIRSWLRKLPKVTQLMSVSWGSGLWLQAWILTDLSLRWKKFILCKFFPIHKYFQN